jgi:hypothetical protein
MKKIIVALIVISMMLVTTTAVLAVPPNEEYNNDKSNGHATITLPAHAVEVAPGIFSLGVAIDKGKVVEGYAIITYRKGFVKPPWAGAPGGPDDEDTSDCYTFLARGAKWKTVEPYMIDPTNIRGLDESSIRTIIAKSIGKWESAAGVDILGDEDLEGIVDRANIGNLNEANEVIFGNVAYEGAIAVAIIWGVFGGPPPFRELVEWDQIYDQVDFDWSTDGTSNKMDFENIATHELGHSVGMGDLYDDKSSEQTMYGYAVNGETKKQTLEAGDINGIYQLYK